MAYERDDSKEITCDIREKIGILTEKKGDWKREVNIVAWNGGEAKFDVRDWSPDHSKMGRGMTLTEQEMSKMVNAYLKYLNAKEKEKADRADYLAKMKEEEKEHAAGKEHTASDVSKSEELSGSIASGIAGTGKKPKQAASM